MADVTQIPWWQWLPIFGWRIVATVESADEVPPRLPRNGAVLVGSPHRPKWLAFDCPCRAGHRIVLSLDKAHRPHWSLLSERNLTLRPSIDYRTPRQRCHYFIRDGRVVWAPEGDQSL